MNKAETVEQVKQTKEILASLLCDVGKDYYLNGVEANVYFNQKIFDAIIWVTRYAELFSQELYIEEFPTLMELPTENDTEYKAKRLRNIVVQYSEYASRTKDSVAVHCLVKFIDLLYEMICFLEMLSAQNKAEGVANA